LLSVRVTTDDLIRSTQLSIGAAGPDGRAVAPTFLLGSDAHSIGIAPCTLARKLGVMSQHSGRALHRGPVSLASCRFLTLRPRCEFRVHDALNTFPQHLIDDGFGFALVEFGL